MQSVPEVEVVKAFHGGASFEALGVDFKDLEGRADWVNADVLDAWYDPSPRVMEAIAPHLAWLIKTSPPTHGEGLREQISLSRGIPVENIVLGAGTSSLMYLAFPKLVTKHSRVTLLDPMYGEYSHIFENVIECSVGRYELSADSGFHPDLDDLVEACKGSDLVVLVNPNSPTGVHVDADFMADFLSCLPANVKVWVDETYIDFAPGKASVESLVATDPRLIVSKSMSKYYGLSGLRVGYLACSAPLAAELERQSPPWSVGLIGQLAGIEALKDEDYYRAKVAETDVLRDQLVRGLSGIAGISRVFPSVTNYVLFELSQPVAAQLCARTAERRVFLRDCDSLSPRFGGRFVRVAVKTSVENEKILSAIRASL